AFSRVIANFLHIESVLPVCIVFLVIGMYFPLLILCGVIQGLKRFIWLAMVQMSWGGLRLVTAVLLVFGFSLGLISLLLGIIAATIGTVCIALILVLPLFSYPEEQLDRNELGRIYGLILPVIITISCITILKNIDVVCAKRFFDPESAKAYANAAFFGSAFFTLTGIFMVMFPLVSEENTRGSNPITFLIKSCGFVSVLSVIGIVIAWFAPHIPMYIINVGEYVPGAMPLMRVFGLVILPVSLVNIMSNYFLARHQWRFIPVLVMGMILQFLFIGFNHQTPLKMLAGIGIANMTTFVCMLMYSIIEHRNFTKTLLSRQESHGR
ncbi:MAG TPA: hypothetical protein VMZ04_05390, partial [Anaerolineae bacterium]|nr:hypothetical protein [Anaerolineae bacterium]